MNQTTIVQHQVSQHFYSNYTAYKMNEMHLVNKEIHYIALTASPIPYLADGVFIIDINNYENLENWIPIQYKLKREIDTNPSLLEYVYETVKRYDATSAIIEIGVENWDLINPQGIDNYLFKVLIKDYTNLSRETKPEYELETFKLLEYLNVNKDIYNSYMAFKINKLFHDNWNRINYNNDKLREIIKNIISIKKEIFNE